MVPLGHDIERLPIRIVYAEGRVVRVIRPGGPVPLNAFGE